MSIIVFIFAVIIELGLIFIVLVSIGALIIKYEIEDAISYMLFFGAIAIVLGYCIIHQIQYWINLDKVITI